MLCDDPVVALEGDELRELLTRAGLPAAQEVQAAGERGR
jgi:hypothetical protein